MAKSKSNKTAELLLAEKERLAVTLAGIGEGVISVDTSGKITLMNRVAEELTGCPFKSAEGAALPEVFRIVDTESGLAVTNPVQAVLHTGQKVSLADPPILKSADGSERIISCSGSPMNDSSGSIIGVVLVFQDITHEKMSDDIMRASAQSLWETNCELQAIREELTRLNASLEDKVRERTSEVQRLMKQKDQLIRQLGHDLKTPLTPMIGLLPLIREQLKDEDLVGMLDIIAQNANYMKELVNKTLAHARVNSESATLNLQPVSLRSILEEILSNNRFLLAREGLEVCVECGGDITVSAEPLLLREALENVLSNAVKFSFRGGTITVKAQKSGEGVAISVSDQGVGMAEDTILKIFDEFYKADDSRHDLGSSGLGLTICKRIVEKHGGSIWAESPGIGKGSTIQINLPLVEKRQENAA